MTFAAGCITVITFGALFLGGFLLLGAILTGIATALQEVPRRGE